jgi:hypothetical protein
LQRFVPFLDRDRPYEERRLMKLVLEGVLDASVSAKTAESKTQEMVDRDLAHEGTLTRIPDARSKTKIRRGQRPNIFPIGSTPAGQSNAPLGYTDAVHSRAGRRSMQAVSAAKKQDSAKRSK